MTTLLSRPRETVAPALSRGDRRRPPRRIGLLDRAGFYEPRPRGVPTTTRQAEVLNLAMSRQPSGHEGTIIGIDAISQAPIMFDPFTAYRNKLLSNINVCIVGDIGKGKTSLMTTGLIRQLPLGRQVVVFDKKQQEGAGEYTIVADDLRTRSLAFKAGRRTGTRLNMLDPAIALGTDRRDDDEDRPAGQLGLVKAILTDTMMLRGLSETDHASVARNLDLVAADATEGGYAPEINHLWRRMLNPQPGDGDPFGVYADDYARWGRDCGLALKRLAEDELCGLVDGATTDDVHRALEHPFVHIDLSGLPNDDHALRIVMTTLNTWLVNRLADRSKRHLPTCLGIEEAHAIADGSTGRLVLRNMKLSRGWGLSTWSAFHHLSDFEEGSPARALMRESSIVYLYAQGRTQDAEECVRMWDLPRGSVETLMSLGQGECLLLVGSAPPILMRHLRSPIEVAWTNSDRAITGV